MLLAGPLSGSDGIEDPKGSSGQEVDVRVTTWADGPDRVPQTWETLKDGGSSYKTGIELLYAR